MVIFATSNGTERLSKPLLSRFTIFEIPEYTYEELETIAVSIFYFGLAHDDKSAFSC